MSTYIYICMCVCDLCVCMCVYIYIYIHTSVCILKLTCMAALEGLQDKAKTEFLLAT